ncbi:MAG: septum formation initiator family protein [Maricaulaceae bacterium]
MGVFRQLAPLAVILTVMSYFAVQGWRGERGMVVLFETERTVVQLEAELARALANKARLEKEAALLRDDGLDLDLLEERAREILNFAHPQDFVISLDLAAPDPQPQALVARYALEPGQPVRAQ